MFVDGMLRGVGVKFLVDTGATDTLISSTTYFSIPSQNRPPLNKGVQVQQVDGAALQTLGSAWVEIQIGNISESVLVVVADIETPGILGMNFLLTTDGTVDLVKRQLCLRGERIQCTLKGERSFCARVVVMEDVRIPPGHEAIIQGEPMGSHNKEFIGPGLIEPNVNFKKEMMVAPSLVNTDKAAWPVRVFNAGVNTRVIKKGVVLGKVMPIEETEVSLLAATSTTSSSTTIPYSTRVPQHLQDLFERSTVGLTETDRELIAALLVEFQDVFSRSDGDLGRTDQEPHDIDTKDHAPIRERFRRVPFMQQQEIDSQVKKMLEQGVISPSDSPWASPVVLVQKKDGSKRFCVDYRKLNEATVKDAYPLPRIDESLEALGGAQWFSTLDLASGYWQVGLTERAKKKSAFVVRGGLYEFNVMPFGLCNAPATFERLMERVLSGLQWEILMLYLDDVIVYAGTVKEEIDRLRVVFQRLRGANLKLKPSKCSLFQRSVKYLGHVVSNKGVHTDPDKIAVVAEWPVPVNIEEVRSFVGLASYYRKFVKGFAEIAKPLHQLTGKNVKFAWSPEAEQAFQELKSRLIAAPILAYPMPEGDFVLDTDASQHAMGAVLQQVQDGETKVIGYASKTFSKEQRNYCVTRKELCAVITYVKHFRPYLYGRKFTIRTDHGSLVWLTNFKEPEGQLARWIEVLQQYDYRIIHRPGRNHRNADSLSRRPCRQCGRNNPKCDLGTTKSRRNNKSTNSDQKELDQKHLCVEPDQESAVPDSQGDRLEVHGLAIPSPDNRDKEPVPARVNAITVDADITLEVIRKHQMEDDTMAPILQWKEQKKPRPEWDTISNQSPHLKTYLAQWDLMEVRDGILVRRWESDDGKSVHFLTVLPQGLRKSVLKELHGVNTAGHLGVKKTTGKVKERFYWVGYHADVRSFLRQCELCARRKSPAKKSKARLRQYQVGGPLERIAVDVVGPLPETHNGNKYILVIGDYWTKWTEAYAIPDQTSETVAKKIVEEFVCRFGIPKELHSDQGRNFESSVFSEMCLLLGIAKTRTTPYRPQSDGMIERFNRTLVNAIALMIQPFQQQRDWDQYIPYFGFAYRSSIQETTMETPNMLMLGREVRCPLDLTMEGPEDEKECETDYAAELREKLRAVHDRVRHALELNIRRQKKNYDRSATDRKFRVEEFVWLHNPAKKPGICKKLTLPWEGPYMIIAKFSDVVIKIQKTPRSKPKIVHSDRLKQYEGPPLKPWRTSNTAAKDTAEAIDEQIAEITQEKPNEPGPTGAESGKTNTTTVADQEVTNKVRRNPARNRQLPARYR